VSTTYEFHRIKYATFKELNEGQLWLSSLFVTRTKVPDTLTGYKPEGRGGSIPDTCDHTMALASTQPPADVSSSHISWGVKTAGE
jgi:hypothetical protein